MNTVESLVEVLSSLEQGEEGIGLFSLRSPVFGVGLS